MHRSPSLYVAAVLAGLCTAPAARPGELKAELDCAANPQLLDTHFARYGYQPKKIILREPQGVRFRMPALKRLPQTGLYSYVALAGNFEVSATYDWVAAPMPEGGYGVSCGIAVEVSPTGPSVALARAYVPGKSNGYVITKGTPAEGGQKFEPPDHNPTKAKSG